MTKEELVAFLKDNLSVDVTATTECARYSDSKGIRITVKILLSDEVISSSMDFGYFEI